MKASSASVPRSTGIRRGMRSCPVCETPASNGTSTGGMVDCSACRVRFLAPQGRIARLERSSAGSVQVTGELQLTETFRRRFEITGLLGVGGMGAVYSALRKEDGRPVAIKFLLRREDAEHRRRFLREARTMTRLDHPHVIRLLDVQASEEVPYLVMELLTGGSLREWLQDEGALPVGAALEIMSQVLAGLTSVHRQGVVHRDLKPENILFDESGNAKVCDLGIARPLGDGVTRLTATGMVIGTPLYMAPELLQGAPATVASDLYACGMMLLEMLAGKVSATSFKILKMLQRNGRTPGRHGSEMEAIPRSLRRLILRCLSPEPEERPRCARTLGEELGVSGRPGTTPAHGPMPELSTFGPRLGAVVLACALLGFFLPGWRPEAPVEHASSGTIAASVVPAIADRPADREGGDASPAPGETAVTSVKAPVTSITPNPSPPPRPPPRQPPPVVVVAHLSTDPAARATPTPTPSPTPVQRELRVVLAIPPSGGSGKPPGTKASRRSPGGASSGTPGGATKVTKPPGRASGTGLPELANIALSCDVDVSTEIQELSAGEREDLAEFRTIRDRLPAVIGEAESGDWMMVKCRLPQLEARERALGGDLSGAYTALESALAEFERDAEVLGLPVYWIDFHRSMIELLAQLAQKLGKYDAAVSLIERSLERLEDELRERPAEDPFREGFEERLRLRRWMADLLQHGDKDLERSLELRRLDMEEAIALDWGHYYPRREVIKSYACTLDRLGRTEEAEQLVAPFFGKQLQE